MKSQLFSCLLMAMAFAISMQAIPVQADSSVSWGEPSEAVAVSSELRWAKPKTVRSSTPRHSSGVVTASYVEEDSKIEQVQFAAPTTPPPLPPVNKLTPAQMDTLYPEKRPQLNTPPTGATSTPLSTTNPPSSFTAPKPEAPTPPAPATVKSDLSTAPMPAPKSTVKETVKPAPMPTVDRPALDGSTMAPRPLTTAPATVKPTPFSKNTREITCPQTAGFKSIKEISYDIRPMPGELPKECPLVTTPYNGRHFGMTCFQWKASALCTKGAYFEDVQLERYGHTISPCLEPFISGGKFFLTIPLLPYYMGITPPNECVYTLGYYRVGSCAPYMLDPFPVSIRAILFEAAAVGGAVALIP